MRQCPVAENATVARGAARLCERTPGDMPSAPGRCGRIGILGAVAPQPGACSQSLTRPRATFAWPGLVSPATSMGAGSNTSPADPGACSQSLTRPGLRSPPLPTPYPHLPPNLWTTPPRAICSHDGRWITPPAGELRTRICRIVEAPPRGCSGLCLGGPSLALWRQPRVPTRWRTPTNTLIPTTTAPTGRFAARTTRWRDRKSVV